MIEPRLIELMHLVIDGVASPRERAELESAIAGDSGARAYYESLALVVEKLNADPMPEPPAELEPRILQALEHAAKRPAAPMASRHRFFSGALRPWSTFGLGLAAGLFIFAVVQRANPRIWDASRDVNPGSVSGSMLSESGKKVRTIAVETTGGAVSGSAAVNEQDDEMVVQVRLQSTVPVEWRVEFDAKAWTLLGVERQGTATASFAADRGSVQGVHTGEGGADLVFAGSADAAQAVVLKILQGGQPIFESRPSSVK